MARAGDASSTWGKLKGSAGADADLVGTDAPAAPDRLGADYGHGDDGDTGLQRQTSDSALGFAQRPGPDARPLGEDQHDVAPLENRLGGLDHLAVAGAAIDGERAERGEDPCLQAISEQFLLGHVVHRSPGHRRDHERVEEAAMVGRDDHRALGRNVFAPDPREPEVDVEERLQYGAHEPIRERIGPVFAGPLMQHFVTHLTEAYPF